jgi:flagellar biosynthesis protein FlhB
MADQDNDSKTELPSDKKIGDALAKGNFARSPELQTLCIIGAALGVMAMTLATAGQEVGALAVGIFSSVGKIRPAETGLPVQAMEVFLVFAKVAGPVVAAAVLASLLVGGLQSGFNVTPEVLGIKFEKLNPVEGFSRVFSKTTLVHGVVDFAKVCAIGLVLWVAAKELFSDPLFSSQVETAYLGRFLSDATVSFLSRLLLALGVIAALSYIYEKRRVFNDLKMTREEVKEERKQSEGDAFVKGALRRMARRLLQKQMLAQVPMADVVVTNPTHYAVALKYERGVDQAPVILAKGENRFALRIKALAAENGVPVIENKPVARMLHGLGKVGEEIPPGLYQAVAEILALVYRTHRYYFYRLRARRAEAASRAGAPRAA